MFLLYAFIMKIPDVLLCTHTNYLYSSVSFMLLTILKSSIPPQLWVVLFLMNDGAYLLFFSYNLLTLFKCLSVFSLHLSPCFTSLLRLAYVFSLGGKWRGLELVLRLLEDKLWEIAVLS